MIRELLAEPLLDADTALGYLREAKKKKVDRQALCNVLHDPGKPGGYEKYMQCVSRRSSSGYVSPFSHHLAEATYTPASGSRLYTAKSLARTLRAPLEVIKTAVVPVSGAQNRFMRVWQGDRGKLLSSDGNNYVVMTQRSGRVVLAKRDFDKIFRYLDDEELIFSDPEENEMI